MTKAIICNSLSLSRFAVEQPNLSYAHGVRIMWDCTAISKCPAILQTLEALTRPVFCLLDRILILPISNRILLFMKQICTVYHSLTRIASWLMMKHRVWLVWSSTEDSFHFAGHRLELRLKWWSSWKACIIETLSTKGIGVCNSILLSLSKVQQLNLFLFNAKLCFALQHCDLCLKHLAIEQLLNCSRL